MSNKMGNFRVPAGSQSGGNPKKKRRTSTNTATPVNNPPNDMGPPSMMTGNPAGAGAPNIASGNDTVFASNPFDDSASSMSPGQILATEFQPQCNNTIVKQKIRTISHLHLAWSKPQCRCHLARCQVLPSQVPGAT